MSDFGLPAPARVQLLQSHAYQDEAARVFEEVKRQVGPLLPEARIDHVGSSSIPGAISKGAYNELKTAHAAMDTLAYREAKATFIERIVNS